MNKTYGSKLAIIIPAYNESKTIKGVVKSISDYGYPIVVDDDRQITPKFRQDLLELVLSQLIIRDTIMPFLQESQRQ